MNLTDPTGMNYFVGGGVNDPEVYQDGFNMGPLGTASNIESMPNMVDVSPQWEDYNHNTGGSVGSEQNTLDNPYSLESSPSVDGTITVAFSGSYEKGEPNGPGEFTYGVVWGQVYGLGFTVYGSVRGGGIGHIGDDPNPSDPKGAWTIQQFVSSYKEVNGRVTDKGGKAKQELSLDAPHSVKNNEFRYWDHPGVQTRGLNSFFGKYNFTVKAVNGDKQIEIKFHMLITFSNGNGSARWGAGEFKK